MAEDDHTWSHLAEMVRARCPENPQSAELTAREAFEAEEIATYARQDEAEEAEEEVLLRRATFSSRSRCSGRHS
jgi:hypothetical protein